MASPCTNQSSRLSFTGIWNPNKKTTITTTNGVLTFSSIDENADYDSFRRRSFAPMIVMNMATTVCVTANIKLTIESFRDFQTCIGGFMFLSPSYDPLFECGLGITSYKKELSTESPLPYSPVSPVYEEDYTLQQKLFTMFTPHYEDSPLSVYTPENVDFDQSINVKITYDKNTRNLSFFDGTKTYTSTTTFIPSYIAFFMRGKGKNTFEISNLSYNGISDTSPFIFSSTIPDNDLIINNATIIKNLEIGLGDTDLNTCSNVCDSTPDCDLFIYNRETQKCSLNKYTNLELVNLINISPSPIPLNKQDIYIKKNRFPYISDYFLFSKNENFSNLVINTNLSIYSLCIDNDFGENDFLAFSSDKLNVYTGNFEYSIVKHPITQKGVIGLKFSISGNIFYGIPKEDSSYRKLLFLNDSNPKTIIDSNLETLNVTSTYNVRKMLNSSTTSFESLYIIATSSIGNFAIDSSNSFVINKTSNPTKYYLSSYKINDIQNTPNNQIKVSNCKLVLSNNPTTKFMTILPGIICILNSNSLWSNLDKGEFFTNKPLRNIQSTLSETFSSPLIPQFTLPASYSFPSEFLNGWGFFCITPETTYAIHFNNDRLQYTSYGCTYTYIIALTNRGVIFTDNGGNQHLIYIDPLDNMIHDQFGEDNEIGPFFKTFPIDKLGNSYSYVEPSNNAGTLNFVRITFETFSTIKVYIYKNVSISPFDIGEIMFYVENPSEEYTYELNDLTPYYNSSQIVLNQIFQFFGKNVVWGTPIQYRNTRSYPTTFSINQNNNLECSISFDGGQTLKNITAGELSFDLMNYVSGNDTFNFTNFTSYSSLQNKLNLYELNIRVVLPGGTIETYLYDKRSPHKIIKKTPTNDILYKRTKFYPIEFIPSIKETGRVVILSYTSTSITFTIENSYFSEYINDRKQVVISLINQTTNQQVSLSNSPQFINFSNLPVTINTNTLQSGSYRLNVFVQDSLFKPQTGGYFEIDDYTPTINPKINIQTINSTINNGNFGASVFYQNDIYTCDTSNNRIIKISGINTQTPVQTVWVTSSTVHLNQPVQILIHENSMYILNYAGNNVVVIDNFTTSTTSNRVLISGRVTSRTGTITNVPLNLPTSMIIFNNDMYISDESNNIIKITNFKNANGTSSIWASSTTGGTNFVNTRWISIRNLYMQGNDMYIITVNTVYKIKNFSILSTFLTLRNVGSSIFYYGLVKNNFMYLVDMNAFSPGTTATIFNIKILKINPWSSVDILFTNSNSGALVNNVYLNYPKNILINETDDIYIINDDNKITKITNVYS